MPVRSSIVSLGGVIEIRHGEQTIRVASVDGTPHPEVMRAWRDLLAQAISAKRRHPVRA